MTLRTGSPSPLFLSPSYLQFFKIKFSFPSLTLFSDHLQASLLRPHVCDSDGDNTTPFPSLNLSRDSFGFFSPSSRVFLNFQYDAMRLLYLLSPRENTPVLILSGKRDPIFFSTFQTSMLFPVAVQASNPLFPSSTLLPQPKLPPSRAGLQLLGSEKPDTPIPPMTLKDQCTSFLSDPLGQRTWRPV